MSTLRIGFAVCMLMSISLGAFADDTCPNSCDQGPVAVANSSPDFNVQLAAKDFASAAAPTWTQLLGSWLLLGTASPGNNDSYPAVPESDNYDPKGLGKTLSFWVDDRIGFLGSQIGPVAGFDTTSEEMVSIQVDGAYLSGERIHDRICKIVAAVPSRLICVLKSETYGTAEKNLPVSSYEGYISLPAPR